MPFLPTWGSAHRAWLARCRSRRAGRSITSGASKPTHESDAQQHVRAWPDLPRRNLVDTGKPMGSAHARAGGSARSDSRRAAHARACAEAMAYPGERVRRGTDRGSRTRSPRHGTGGYVQDGERRDACAAVPDAREISDEIESLAVGSGGEGGASSGSRVPVSHGGLHTAIPPLPTPARRGRACPTRSPPAPLLRHQNVYAALTPTRKFRVGAGA